MSPLQMTEKEWKSWVIDAAKLCGWRYAHFVFAKTKRGWRTPQEGDLGFPDMVLARPPRVIVAELKIHPPTQLRGRPREDQQAWLDAFAANPGVEVFVWRPGDQDSVLDILRRKEAV